MPFSGAVDLSAPAPGEHAASSRAAFDALTEKERADLARMARDTDTDPAPTGERVEAMFLVVIPRGGVAVAIPDVAQAAGYHGPAASVEQMNEACRVVHRDIDQSRAAQVTVSTQMQMAAAMQRQADAAELRTKLGL